ncbi:Cro/CI family transcriptional regulator [Enterobacter bugandensis]|uniref:Cro/CI family transcriptional regulator n=1 Tax=Enterobacter bugandensis TaxID=881260 RepID=A0AA42PZC1_9ENTR|nr:Cro/CI family transcriptional regulator [Enterobacter bugandensis]MDH1321157.1 Cro/CI family transcriptional regulator [Enterobacter bugandensis]
MYKKDVLHYFKQTKFVAEALGLSHVAVVRWKKIIPELRARKLEEITGGKLRFDKSLYGNKDTQKPFGKLNHENQSSD